MNQQGQKILRFATVSSLFPRKHLKKLTLAGLLTYSHFESLPEINSLKEISFSVAKVCSKCFKRAYSSGTVQDFHLFPFSSYATSVASEPKRCKGRIN